MVNTADDGSEEEHVESSDSGDETSDAEWGESPKKKRKREAKNMKKQAQPIGRTRGRRATQRKQTESEDDDEDEEEYGGGDDDAYGRGVTPGRRAGDGRVMSRRTREVKSYAEVICLSNLRSIFSLFRVVIPRLPTTRI